jgi:alkanesulfonate monooxygenase SsuD/methylene tetrahydromethanopterin reductase-like flavin-dependent oxidoreductase (luciferase family)
VCDAEPSCQLNHTRPVLDHLSGGRLELGIGAGHAFTEYAAIGQPFDPPAVRKARLAEAIDILRPLLDGATVSFSGEHYHIENVRTKRALQPRLPFLVAVSGRRDDLEGFAPIIDRLR